MGIGASAGGLRALRTFFTSVPDDPGVAFVVVVHLSPEHESQLAELIQPHCSMPVQQVSETMASGPGEEYARKSRSDRMNAVTTNLFQQAAGGEPTNNVFKLIREPLMIELRTALHAARERQQPVRVKAVSMDVEGKRQRVVLRVQPATDPELAGFYLVILDEMSQEPRSGQADIDDADPPHATAREREVELDLNRQRLQAMIEEFESSCEEMKASNEELQSANEELRSTMEVLLAA